MKGNNTEDGEQIKKKTNGGSFYYQKGRRSQREMEGTNGDQPPQSLTAVGGHPSKNYHGGVVDLVSIFLITRISGISGGTPALWLPAGFRLREVNTAAPPKWVRG